MRRKMIPAGPEDWLQACCVEKPPGDQANVFRASPCRNEVAPDKLLK